MIKKLLVLVVFITLMGCGDDDGCDLAVNLQANQTQLAADVEGIDTYLSDNSITAQVHESGLRYVVNNEGTGGSANLCNSVSVTYVGKLMSDKSTFDSSSTPVTFPLSRLITGWQIGIPLIKSGGSVTLYIPSVYGYGASGIPGAIPSNANLIFEIELTGIQ